jgi:hypothetical protein
VKKLPLRQVDTDRLSASGNKPTPALAGAAANLYDPSSRDVAQQAYIVFGKSFRSPDEAHVTQELLVSVLVRVCIAVPPKPIGMRRLLGVRATSCDARGVGGLGSGARLELASGGICEASIYHPAILALVANPLQPES